MVKSKSKPTQFRRNVEKTAQYRQHLNGIQSGQVKASKKNTQKLHNEIKILQKGTNLLIPQAPFLRLVRELISDATNNQHYRITSAALEALREATESVLIALFEDSYLLSLHAKRVTLFPQDIRLALVLLHDHSLLTNF